MTRVYWRPVDRTRHRARRHIIKLINATCTAAGRRNQTCKMRLVTVFVTNVMTLLMLTTICLDGVDAFARHATAHHYSFSTAAPDNNTRKRHSISIRLYSNNNNDNGESWISKRLDRASITEIRRDAFLVSCYVLCRFFIYDICAGIKSVPGWELQDVAYLTGTCSSAVVLVTYWTIAGLLSRGFETSGFKPIQTLVNVALSCPIWLATEHLFEFGPPDAGGSTLGIAVMTGFLSMSSAILLGRAVTSQWE